MCCSLMVEFFSNTLPSFWWNSFIIYIVAWFVNYYILFFCIIFYWHIVLFLDFVIWLFWYDVGVLLVVFIFTHFLYCIFVLQWIMDLYFIFQIYFFLDPLSVLIFRFIIIFVKKKIRDWISGAPLKVWLTINHLWFFLCYSYFLYTIYECVGDG